jgi:hypothetical protein
MPRTPIAGVPRRATLGEIMQAFEIEADAERRVLHTNFRGVVTPRELAAAAERSAALIAQMQPGFTVVADLSELESMDLDCVPYITRMMDLFRRAQVGRVLRIIPDASKDIGFTLLSHTHYRGQVPFETLRSMDEARLALGSRG